MTSLLIPFYKEVTGVVGKERAVDIVYVGFRNTFESLTHKILIDKRMKNGLDEQRIRLKPV